MGSEGRDARNSSPARAAEAIAVSASTITDERASFANFGPLVAVFAPGVSVVSAGIASDSSQATKSGTSMVRAMDPICHRSFWQITKC